MATGTIFQQWAQKRNMGKYRLRGMLKQLEVMHKEEWILPNEQKSLHTIFLSLGRLLDRWDEQNPASKNRYKRLINGRR